MDPPPTIDVSILHLRSAWEEFVNSSFVEETLARAAEAAAAAATVLDR